MLLLMPHSASVRWPHVPGACTLACLHVLSVPHGGLSCQNNVTQIVQALGGNDVRFWTPFSFSRRIPQGDQNIFVSLFSIGTFRAVVKPLLIIC